MLKKAVNSHTWWCRSQKPGLHYCILFCLVYDFGHRRRIDCRHLLACCLCILYHFICFWFGIFQCCFNANINVGLSCLVHTSFRLNNFQFVSFYYFRSVFFTIYSWLNILFCFCSAIFKIAFAIFKNLYFLTTLIRFGWQKKKVFAFQAGLWCGYQKISVIQRRWRKPSA